MSTRAAAAGHGGLQLLGRLVVLLAVLFGLLAGAGLLVTGVLHRTLLSGEDGVDRSLAARRTPTWNAVTGFWSLVGSTTVIIGVMLVMAVVFRLVFKRWRESAFLVLAVSAQALLFLLTTLVISRQRPAVPELDRSPPTSSFPSGHTGASTALYLGIAVAVVWHLRRREAHSGRGRRGWWPVAAVLLLVPVSVALSRLYRGMHHPSDVVAGAANGALCVLVSARTLLREALPPGLARLLDPRDTRASGGRAAARGPSGR